AHRPEKQGASRAPAAHAVRRSGHRPSRALRLAHRPAERVTAPSDSDRSGMSDDVRVDPPRGNSVGARATLAGEVVAGLAPEAQIGHDGPRSLSTTSTTPESMRDSTTARNSAEVSSSPWRGRASSGSAMTSPSPIGSGSYGTRPILHSGALQPEGVSGTVEPGRFPLRARNIRETPAT